jgi:predicted CopG family antitoxin
LKKKAEKDWTLIRVRVETRKKLKELGKKGETYDEVILELLGFFKERGAEVVLNGANQS